MREVYLVYLGHGDDASNGVYVEYEFVDAVYSSRDAAIAHANEWFENRKKDIQTNSGWKYVDELEELIIDENVLLQHTFCRDDGVYEEKYCRVVKYNVLDKFGEES